MLILGEPLPPGVADFQMQETTGEIIGKTAIYEYIQKKWDSCGLLQSDLALIGSQFQQHCLWSDETLEGGTRLREVGY